ncbi:MAG: TIGR03960 family B12-binding radical SAM protein [Clostridia bacterium]|nr:TIGR03960 family B12-binding radical SAM protein [Clostridia bacterium]
MNKVNLSEIRDILLSCEKPSRYTGGEYGLPAAKEGEINFCMCFPDLYEVGMSNLGIKIVAKSFTQRGYCADFCFAPAKDFGKKIKERGFPLYSLSLKAPLKEFDIVGFSLQYELCYTNVLYMLDLAGIPLRREDRKGKGYPLIIAGGPCAANPEPLADFIDVFFIGDGETCDADAAEIYKKLGDTEEFYREISKIDGVYCPCLTDVIYGEDGKIKSFEGIKKVKRALIDDLDGAIFPEQIAVPNCESVHDRAVIEVMRGCYRGCRFCQAGFIYRPVRKRSVQTLTRQASALIKNTGYDEVSLNSLSTGDYGKLKELLFSLKKELPPEVTLALPSLRVDSFEGEFAQEARRISLTFAPEAGTQRLRDVINKDITEEEILHAAESAFNAGYSAVKLYFMLGLPTETDEDLKGIADLCVKIRKLYGKQKRAKQLRISISVATFIPKPFTPFQWEKQATEEEVEQKQQFLRSVLPNGVKFSWNSYYPSLLEAAFARGDRPLGKVLEAAYKNGCVFDGWDSELDGEKWKDAFNSCGISPCEYSRGRDEDEILPWDFIDMYIEKKLLL